ncbi:hypothetical protein NL676_021430 [Syzygium grande]|nr:hypothetical protein NL676_021430 [Syzygium grande]
MSKEDFGAQPVIIGMDTESEGEEPMDWESDIEPEPKPMEQELEPKDDSGCSQSRKNYSGTARDAGINFSVAAGRSSGMRGVSPVNDRWRPKFCDGGDSMVQRERFWFGKGVKIDLETNPSLSLASHRVTGNRRRWYLWRDWSSLASGSKSSVYGCCRRG